MGWEVMHFEAVGSWLVGWLDVRGFGALSGVNCFRTMWLWSFFSGINLLGTWRVNFWCLLGYVGMEEVVTAVVGGCKG